MSQKIKHPQNNHAPNPDKASGHGEHTKRHVYVEPGVQIDLVKDLREKYETSQNDGTTHNKRQLRWTKISAGLLLIYVGLTMWQAWSAQLSLNAIRTQFRIDQRGWLRFDAAPANPGDERVLWNLSVNQPIMYPLKVANTGKTPATNVYMKIFVDIIDASQEPPLDHVDSGEVGTAYPFGSIRAGIVFPNTDFRQDVVRPQRGGGPRVATQDEVDALKNGSAYLAVYGIISYDDALGAHRWTKFCKWIPRDGLVAYDRFNTLECVRYNSVDSD